MEERKKEFLVLFQTLINREGKDELLDWLEHSDFFTAPASTRFHGNHEGGLLEHSLNVYQGGEYFIGKIFERSKLALLTHLADMESTYLLEGQENT